MAEEQKVIKRCAACRNEKPVSEMKVCMHAQMHNYVCDSKCMNDFYNPPKKPAQLPSQVAAEVVQGWIPVSERLPEPDQVVALMNDAVWMNTGDPGFDCNWHGAGYLVTDFGRPHWTVFGETRAQCLDAATHWAPMPALLATSQEKAE